MILSEPKSHADKMDRKAALFRKMADDLNAQAMMERIGRKSSKTGEGDNGLDIEGLRDAGDGGILI